ncbi:MAG: hypothetical protein ACK5HS_04575 [Mycoplasmatales bacterium]
MLKTPTQWKIFYNKEYKEEKNFLINGVEDTLRKRNSMIQKVIVNELLRRLFSFDITVTLEDDDTNLFSGKDITLFDIEKQNAIDLNLTNIIHDTLAYGEVLVDFDNDNIPITLSDYKKKTNKAGELIYVNYKLHINDYYVDVSHFIDNETGLAKKIVSEGGKTKSEETFNQTYLRCFLSKSYVDGADYTQPIYANALNNILEFNDTYSEMSIDRNLSRKMVILPQQLIQSARQKLQNNGVAAPSVNKNDRLFKAWDVENPENQQPLYLSGDYNPQPFIDDLQIQLRLISLHSGLGYNFLSLDKATGLKTATEIKADDKDIEITMLNVQSIFTDIISSLSLHYTNISEVNVHYEDVVSEDIINRDARLMKEYMAGLISKEQYHLQRGVTKEELEDIIPKEITLNEKFDTESN